MSASFLKVTMIGNLGRDPEMRLTPTGTPVTSFSVCANRTYLKGDVKVVEETWVRVTAWGKLGEICNQYLHKGSLVHVEGRLTPGENGSPRTYVNNKGETAASYELNASDVRFLSKHEGGDAVSNEPSGEDIPF